MTDRQRIEHIIEHINNIERCVLGLDQDGFFRNDTVKYACYGHMVIISEAASKITKEGKKQFESIEWQLITDFRNLIIHEYFIIDWHIVWDVIELNLPALKRELEHY
jgi:uncharacterized protein with HEPN domain